MGKTAKKNNRKMKKTVRRTLGALCMLSAITIAAIPTPENRAYNPSDYDTETKIQAATDYPSSVTKITFANNKDYSTDASCEKAYYAYQGSDGIWIMDWQFKYKNDGANGYLAKYNSQYQRDNIDIPFNVYSDFYYITGAHEQAYFNDGQSGTPVSEKVDIDVYAGDVVKTTRTVYSLYYKHNMDGDPEDTSSNAYKNRDFFNQEFPTEYSEYKTAYSDWKNDLADPKTHQKPEEKEYRLVDKYAGNYDGQVQYLCDALFNSGLNMKLASAKLRKYDSADKFTNEVPVFIPMLASQASTNPLTTPLGSFYTAPTQDNSGNDLWCLTDKTSSIAYIGQKAFENVGNVDTLTIADEISVIGDYAFANSFIKSIKLSKGCTIGNNCFENCQSLTNVVIPQGVTKIGAEAFAGSGIPSVIIPISVNEIGMGAFKDCGSLTSVSFDETFSGERAIDDYAFFNCTKLNSVNIENSNVTSIGKCAFAIDTKKEEVNKLENFVFPKAISDPSKMGEFVLYNRKGLDYVKLPTDLGATSLISTLFYGCVNLGCVEFPDSLGSTSYESDNLPSSNGALFYTITNPNFYVKGPKLNSSGKESGPRTSTWSAISNASLDTEDPLGTSYVGRNVPYVYIDNGAEYYEVSDGAYVMSISPDGVLNNVSFVPGTDKDIDLVIPAKVGEKNITGMTSDCFSESVLKHLKSLTIVDGSGISSIDDNTFKGCPKLSKVSLGNSITSVGANSFQGCKALESVNLGKNIASIGDNAFENCSKLALVKFDSPDSYSTLNKIGGNAFSTGNTTDGLTFVADINEGYEPFKWAMDKNNYVDDSGLRVCYKTPEPSCLTVILDNKNYCPTLVDYPHFGSELDQICKNYYYEYGLRKFAEEPDCEAQATALASAHDNLCARYEAGNTLETIEYSLIYATEDIIVPSGVTSIDAAGYFTGDSKSVDGEGSKYPNTTSISKYFSGYPYTEYKANGLFAGYYGDNVNPSDSHKYDYYDSSSYGVDPVTGSTLENDPKGNDRIKYVELQNVKYLPDYCFDNCEQLSQVVLGNGLVNAGILPFHDCTKVGPESLGNDTVFFSNGILYQKNNDGTDLLVECLPSRGSIWGVSTVNSSNDPELLNVKDIAEQAFSDCPSITSVDLSDNKILKSIPDKCFKGSELLTDVDLTESIIDIGNEAFADTGAYTKVTVRGKEVALGYNAFSNVAQPKLISYKDSSVQKSAQKQGVSIQHPADDLGYLVKFFTQDGLIQIGQTENVQFGNDAKGPNDRDIPPIDGYVFTGWDRDITNIKGHLDTKAVYMAVSGVTPGVTPGTTPAPAPGTTTPGVTPPAPGPTTPGVTNKVTPTPSPSGEVKKYTLTVVYGSGSGQYAANTKVIIEAISAPEGKEFDKWVVSGSGGTIYSSTSKATTITTAAGDSTVTATYKDATGKSNSSSGTYSRSNTGSGSSNSNGGNNSSGSGTSVNITKPGISDRDKAYASVNGSTDNFIVKVTEDSNAANQIATALANRYPDMSMIKYFPMDISLFDATGNNKIPNDANLSVNVTMPIPDALREYGGNCKVASVVNGNQLEDLPCKFVTVSGIPCVSFTAKHFSPYVIYVDTNNLVYGTADGSPKTGDPIHPKWFVVIALAATSLFLFLKRDRVTIPRTV